MDVPREHNANHSLSPLAPFDREPSAITIRLIPYRPGDAWRLEHPYITEQFGPFLTPFLANHRQLERLCRTPQPPSVVAQQLGTQTHRLYNALATLAATGVIDLHRDGDHLTIVIPIRLKLWITSRTRSSEVCTSRAITVTRFPPADASTTNARR